MNPESPAQPTPRKIVRSGFGEFEMSTLAEDECVMASGLDDGGWIVVRREAAQTPPSETAQDGSVAQRCADAYLKEFEEVSPLQSYLAGWDAALRSSGMGTPPWNCKARSANTGANDPQDCNWPFCGCDPHADKVMEAVEESDLSVLKLADDIAKEVGGKAADTHMLNLGLNKLRQQLRKRLTSGMAKEPTKCGDSKGDIVVDK